MSSYVEWIKAGLKNGRGKNRTGIAAALGLDKSQVTRLLKGDRRLRADEVGKIAAYLEVTPPGGFGEEGADFAGKDQQQSQAPIFRVVPDAADGWLIERHNEPIDSKPRAPHFINSAKVFGFYVPDDAMAPRFKLGEIAWVDPARPAKPGDDVAMIGKAKSPGPERILLAELRAANAGEIVAAQHKDRIERKFEANRWTALLVLPRD